VGVLVISILVFTVFYIVCIVFLLFRLCIFILIFLFAPCRCYCHGVTSQLQLIIIIIIIIITYWTLPTYFGKCSVENTERLSWEVALHVPTIVSTE
jgi:hypothetical protein